MRILCYLALLVLFTASYSQISTIEDAKSYFYAQRDDDLLLVSTTSIGAAVEFAFEGDTNNQQIDNSILASIVLNNDTWTAYITYADSTQQEVPYLGTTLNITESNVINSPYPHCPLTALLIFTTKVPGSVEITILGRDEDSHDFTHNSKEITTSHSVPIIGLYAEFNNTVIVNFLSSTGIQRGTQTIYIQTEDAPWNQLNITENKLSTSNPHFFSLSEGIFDEQGYLRWYVPPNYRELYPLTGGLIATMPNISNETNTVVILDYSGQIVQTFVIPNGAHHEVIEKTPGGNFLVLSNVAAGIDSEDLIVEVERSTGAIVKQWDMNDYFQRSRPQNWFAQLHTPAVDWFHANAVSYDPADNTLLISSRHQDLVTKIGYDDGTVKWMICNHEGWDSPYSDYLLTPTNFNTTLDPAQDWAYLQHFPRVMPNGDILLYDNGGTRPGFTNNGSYSDPVYAVSPIRHLGIPKPGGYTRAVQYRVNPTEMTVTKVLEYTHYPDDPTTIVGSVQYLAENIMMIGYGEIGQLRISDISTGELLFSASRVNRFFYRAYPIQFYPEAYTLI